MMDSQSTPEWPKNALPKKVVEWLFDKMLSKWGKQFVDRWSIIDPDKLLMDWAKGLHGLSEMEFRRGVAKLDTFDFPCSQPEFLKACRPEVNPTAAYYEALEGLRSRDQGEVGNWSHPAIFWATGRVSAHDLKNQSYSQIRQRWEACLAIEMEKGQWERIPKPFIAIAGPGNDKRSREQAAQMMEQIKAEAAKRGGMQNTKVVKEEGSKGWARKILEAHRNGDKKLSLIQIRFAREALQITGEEDEKGRTI